MQADEHTGNGWQGWLTLVMRVIVGGVMVVAGGVKLSNLGESVLAVRGYQVLPYELTAPIGYALPVIEVIVGVLVIVGVFTRLSAVITAVLFGVFIVGIAQAWARGLTIDCGCFGGGGEVAADQTRYAEEIVRDVGLLAASLWVVYRPDAPLSVDRWINGPRQPDDTLVEDT